MSMETNTTIATPAGRLALAASATGLTRCTFRPVRSDAGPADPRARRWLDLALDELAAYFAGELQEFTVPVDQGRVPPLHRRILDGLRHVGYGATTTYGELAAELGLVEDGPRQVGAAMARNPVLVVVPCHRVLGAGGKLTGYAGGLAAKQRLLDLEARDRSLQPTLAW
jgi:methylated-DNA-[protein]-cysteine S-methyltransferase